MRRKRAGGARERLWFADELGSVAALAFDTPFDVALGEQGPVELLERADGVGDGEQPPGFAGTVEVLSARGPPGGGVDGFARAAPPGTSTRRPPRLCPAWPG